MKKENKPWIAALLLTAAAGPLCAQQVWRCGNQYSHQPCPGGTTLQASDPRTADDSAQAQSAARRQAKAADELERMRLAREAKAPPANILPQGAGAPGEDKEYKPVHFSAVVPGSARSQADKKKKKTPKKKSG